jgi:hypothetical protein
MRIPDEFVVTDPVSQFDFEFERLPDDDDGGEWYALIIDGEEWDRICTQRLRALMFHGHRILVATEKTNNPGRKF